MKGATAMNQRNDNLSELCPGVGQPDTTCGFEPGEAACQLARLNYRPSEMTQQYACGYAVKKLDCSQARRRYSEKSHPGHTGARV